MLQELFVEKDRCGSANFRSKNSFASKVG